MKNFLGILVAVSFVFVAVNAKAATTTTANKTVVMPPQRQADTNNAIMLKSSKEYRNNVARIRTELEKLNKEKEELLKTKYLN